MIGRVESLHALVGVTFVLDGNQCVEIEFVIDTGFTKSLTLPDRAIAALGLPFTDVVEARLADGSLVMLDVYQATVEWTGSRIMVEVFATCSRPLLGIGMPAGCDLGG